MWGATNCQSLCLSRFHLAPAPPCWPEEVPTTNPDNGQPSAIRAPTADSHPPYGSRGSRRLGPPLVLPLAIPRRPRCHCPRTVCLLEAPPSRIDRTARQSDRRPRHPCHLSLSSTTWVVDVGPRHQAARPAFASCRCRMVSCLHSHVLPAPGAPHDAARNPHPTDAYFATPPSTSPLASVQRGCGAGKKHKKGSWAWKITSPRPREPPPMKRRPPPRKRFAHHALTRVEGGPRRGRARIRGERARALAQPSHPDGEGGGWGGGGRVTCCCSSIHSLDWVGGEAPRRARTWTAGPWGRPAPPLPPTHTHARASWAPPTAAAPPPPRLCLGRGPPR